MSVNINRRGFLQSLIALGASYVLPANATAQQINQAWEAAKAAPWKFSVDQWGTITDTNTKQSETWGDIFWISTNNLKTSTDLINEINECQPLISHFQNLATEKLNELYIELDRASEILQRNRVQKIITAIESDPDNSWQDWIALEGNSGTARFRREIDLWLEQAADYNQSEWFPLDHGSQGQAKSFFESLDNDTLDALKIVIIEGAHPGSTYYAAALRQSVDDANASAESMGLPFRFQDAPHELHCLAD